MTFGTDIEDAKKMNANEFGGPLTYYLAPPAAFSNISWQVITTKLLFFKEGSGKNPFTYH